MPPLKSMTLPSVTPWPSARLCRSFTRAPSSCSTVSPTIPTHHDINTVNLGMRLCDQVRGERDVRTEVMCDDVGLGRATPRPQVLLDVGQLVHREARPQVLVRVTVAQEVPQQQAEARRQALQQLCTPDGL